MEDDKQFEEVTVSKVSKEGNGWSIERSDGWSFFVPQDSPVEPRVGMTARFYGRGIGASVRGLVLDGKVVYYRSAAADEEYRDSEMYGLDAAEWLKRWDEGRAVWTIEMGGMGPGYEQCIHITCAEILRFMLDKKYDPDTWENKQKWEHDRDEIEAMSHKNETITTLGLSGAQWGAAMNIAGHIYRHGPRTVMTDKRVKDRHIQVQRTFPIAA